MIRDGELQIRCADVGEENCPCQLGENYGCLCCPRLQERTRERRASACNCHWEGVCVYNEFMQNREKVYGERRSKRYKICDAKSYGESLKTVTLRVDKGFAIKATRAGSYVFVRGEEGQFFDMPLSVMDTDLAKGELTVLIGGRGPKSRNAMGNKDHLMVRGVYGNGIVGVRELERGLMSTGDRKKHINIFARGTAIAPFINIKEILKDYADFMLYLDGEKLQDQFIEDYLGDLPVRNLKLVDFQWEKEGLLDVAAGAGSQKEKPINLVLASPYYIEEFKKVDPHLIHSNSANLCCGQGICGACTYSDGDGNVHRPCKERPI